MFIMAIRRTKFKGKVSIRGRPKEQAKAEIMVMKQQEAYESRKRKAFFFILLDIVAVISLIVAIYSFYKGEYLRGVLVLLIAVLIFIYYILKKALQKKNKKLENRK